MQELFVLIEERKHSLDSNKLCVALREYNISEGRGKLLKFMPSMAFFVLGFKDMLAYLKVENPRNEVDNILNTHCDEDSDHWTWYLEDMKALGLHTIDASEFAKTTWSDDNFKIRRHVYDTISIIIQTGSSEERLIIVECLEAAFAAFVMNLNVATKGLDLYETLKYFGKHHYDKESDHTMGSWLSEDSKLKTRSNEYSFLEVERMKECITKIFDNFELMFDYWHEMF